MKGARMRAEYRGLVNNKNTELRQKDKVQCEYISVDSVLRWV
jgi:hypothetical protein